MNPISLDKENRRKVDTRKGDEMNWVQHPPRGASQERRSRSRSLRWRGWREAAQRTQPKLRTRRCIVPHSSGDGPARLARARIVLVRATARGVVHRLPAGGERRRRGGRGRRGRCGGGGRSRRARLGSAARRALAGDCPMGGLGEGTRGRKAERGRENEGICEQLPDGYFTRKALDAAASERNGAPFPPGRTHTRSAAT
jgi:hypothetical protein